METIWEIIAPYVGMVGGATGAGTIIYIIIRLLLNKITQKNASAMNSMFNIDTLSQNFADRLAGKTLNIDVTAVTEKALRKLSKQLDERIATVEDTTNSYKHLLALIGNALTKLKALSKDEVAELTQAIRDLEGGYTPPESNETMTVILEPITLEDEKEEPVSSGVNFEGLE